MRATAIACGLFVGLFLPTTIWAQDYDEDDPVRYQWGDRDYLETGQNFGTAYYPQPGRARLEYELGPGVLMA